MTDETSPFDGLDPADGYRAELTSLDSEVAVHVLLNQGGCITAPFDLPADEASCEIKAWSDPTLADHGAASRLQLVMDAICRYFTTGGSWEELERAQARSKQILRGGLDFPGYHYHLGELNTNGVYEHVFLKDDGSGAAILWVEDEFIESTTLEKLRAAEDREPW